MQKYLKFSTLMNLKFFKFITSFDLQIFLLLINLKRIKVQVTTNQISFLMIDYPKFKDLYKTYFNNYNARQI